MAYKTILLCLNEIAELPRLIAAARQLASDKKAHVLGLYVIPAVQIYPSAGLASVAEVYDGNRKYFLDHADKVESQFAAAMKADGIAFSFMKLDTATSLISMAALEESRNADLVVTAATNSDEGLGPEVDFVQRLVIAAGRPVLVLPRNGSDKLDFSTVLLGWDGGREAARAAFDALPLLAKAKTVKIVRVDETARGSVAAASIAETLDRHGVKADIVNVSSDGTNAGAALLRAAKDHGAGLLVMGAYGHSRFTEFVFGGATRHVILSLDMPVLMSH